MHRYLFVFNQTHENFRFAEFAAVCEMLKIPFDPKNYLSNVSLFNFKIFTRHTLEFIIHGISKHVSFRRVDHLEF